MAQDQELLPTTIEKDYALGWVLHGIAQHPVASKWVFKGGTCLKKCFFNTYRFSEDLDFTIPPDEPYDHDSIIQTLQGVTQWVESESGILFPTDWLDLEEYNNPRGKTSFQGKASFVGPLQMSRRTLQRVKFDLTQDEVLVDSPALRELSHPYDDTAMPAPRVFCYSVNEILAEKSRALYERQGRARDVYDVVHIARAFRDAVDPEIAIRVLREKFKFKELPDPTVDLIVGRIDNGVLRANWKAQLGHQLPVLPDIDGFIEGLTEALTWWLAPAKAATPLSVISRKTDEVTLPREAFPSGKPARALDIRPRAPLQDRGRLSPDNPLGRITYGARNHLCLRFRYDGADRQVEPYSLRRPKTGNRLLYTWERMRGRVSTGQIKAFKLQEIYSAKVTDQTFTPRYRVEL
jgi:predicted nucleotidyltransferase component of viral defense system